MSLVVEKRRSDDQRRLIYLFERRIVEALSHCQDIGRTIRFVMGCHLIDRRGCLAVLNRAKPQTLHTAAGM